MNFSKWFMRDVRIYRSMAPWVLATRLPILSISFSRGDTRINPLTNGSSRRKLNSIEPKPTQLNSAHPNSTQDLFRPTRGGATGSEWKAIPKGHFADKALSDGTTMKKKNGNNEVWRAKEAADFLKAHVETIRRLARRGSGGQRER